MELKTCFPAATDPMWIPIVLTAAYLTWESTVRRVKAAAAHGWFPCLGAMIFLVYPVRTVVAVLSVCGVVQGLIFVDYMRAPRGPRQAR